MDISTLIKISSICLGALAFVAIVVRDWIKKLPTRLEAAVIGSVSASTIPSGLALIYGGFDPQFLLKESGFSAYITLSGFVLIFISVRAIYSSFQANEEPSVHQEPLLQHSREAQPINPPDAAR